MLEVPRSIPAASEEKFGVQTIASLHVICRDDMKSEQGSVLRIRTLTGGPCAGTFTPCGGLALDFGQRGP